MNRLALDPASLRTRALDLRGELDIAVPQVCAVADQFTLQAFGYMAQTAFETESSREMMRHVRTLFPFHQNYYGMHHVLFISTGSGWLRIYLYFATEDLAYVQVQGQWFRFSSWDTLSRWLAFLLATLRKGTVYSYYNLMPDKDNDPDSPSASKLTSQSEQEFVDR